jgi:hypothetical protein
MNFPQFDGDDAQFWITCATNYFEMYSIEPPMWVRVATMPSAGSSLLNPASPMSIGLASVL